LTARFTFTQVAAIVIFLESKFTFRHTLKLATWFAFTEVAAIVVLLEAVFAVDGTHW